MGTLARRSACSRHSRRACGLRGCAQVACFAEVRDARGSRPITTYVSADRQTGVSIVLARKYDGHCLATPALRLVIFTTFRLLPVCECAGHGQDCPLYFTLR